MKRNAATTLWVLGILLLLAGSQGCGRGQPPANATDGGKSKTPGSAELFYDDGFPEGQHSPWWHEPGGQLAVVFTPAFYPAVVTEVRFLVGISGVPTTKFHVRIYGGDLSGGPDERLELIEEPLAVSAAFGNKWVQVDMSDRDVLIEEGDFCVSMEWLTPPGDYGSDAQKIGVDYTNPDGRSWWKTAAGTKWQKIEDVGNIGDRDVMIRATVARK
jgi:hypothetical protein